MSPTYDTDEPGQRKIVAWRVESFERMGFKSMDAYALGVRRDVDTEHVRRLVREGCSVGLVKEIVL